MVKSQKDAVVEEVIKQLPTFVKYKDNALLLLTRSDLNLVKINIAHRILNGEISYGKDLSKPAEVHAYARSMVMNHLKKARELNGGSSYYQTRSIATTVTQSPTLPKIKAPKGVNLTLLPEELKELVLKLV